MVVVKRAISFDPEVWSDLEGVAQEERVGISTIVNRALRHELRVRRGLAAVGAWESENGALTDAELTDADRILDASSVGIEDPGPPKSA